MTRNRTESISGTRRSDDGALAELWGVLLVEHEARVLDSDNSSAIARELPADRNSELEAGGAEQVRAA